MGYKNIFITAKPKTGKTTLIKEIINNQTIKKYPLYGFYTEEIRGDNLYRVGFKIVGISTNREGILAHISLASTSEYKVSKYGVSLKYLKDIGIYEIELGLSQDGSIICIDEVGKMELFLYDFKVAVSRALDSGGCRVLASVGQIKDEFIDKIRKRDDVVVFHLNRANFSVLKDKIIKLLIDKPNFTSFYPKRSKKH